jgi:hypothetical protein
MFATALLRCVGSCSIAGTGVEACPQPSFIRELISTARGGIGETFEQLDELLVTVASC